MTKGDETAAQPTREARGGEPAAETTRRAQTSPTRRPLACDPTAGDPTTGLRAIQAAEATDLEIYWLDADARVVDANPAACRASGYSLAEVRRLTLADLDVQTSPDQWVALRHALREGQGPLRLRSRRLCKSGRTYPIEVTAQRLEVAGEELFCGFARDISEDVAAYENAAFFKRVLDRANEAMFWVDASGRFRYVNEAACTLLGVSRHTLLTQSVDLYNPSHTPETWPQHWAELRVFGRRVFQTRLVRADGHTIDVEISANIMILGQEEFNIAFVRDITSQKAVMEEIKRNLYLTRQSQRAARIGHFFYNFDKDIGYSSEVLNEIYGFSSDFAGGLADWMTYVHRDDQAALRDHLLIDVLKAGRPFDREFRIRRADTGALRWLHGRGEVEREAETGHAILIGTALDITERKMAQEQIQNTVEALTRSNVELERFAYIASHDLQEPIRNVVAFSQLLQKRFMGKLGDEADEYLGYIISGAKRMQTLVLDLLDYSRVSTSGRSFARVALDDVLAAVRENLRMSLEESGALLDIDPLPRVYGDEIQLVALFQNLIGNAVKFRRPGVVPMIRVAVERTGPNWTIAVADNGIGIAAEHCPQIFTIFKRLHTDQTYPGTGIGLAVSKRIVERHGGSITVDSVPDQGSRFLLTLPAVTDRG